VRELDGKREELDGVAARCVSHMDGVLTLSTLQSLNLPGSIQALERPVGLPPSLLKKADEVDAAGGTARIRHLVAEAARLSKGHSNTLSEVSLKL
jgi:programmed cell death 6-interacting protein